MIEESEPSEGQNQKIANIYFHPSLGGYLEFNYKKTSLEDLGAATCKEFVDYKV